VEGYADRGLKVRWETDTGATFSGMYFPLSMAPPLGDTRWSPEGTGGLILKAAVRSVGEGNTLLDGSVQVRECHCLGMCNFFDAVELSSYFLTQFLKSLEVLQEEIRCVGEGRGSCIR